MPSKKKSKVLLSRKQLAYVLDLGTESIGKFLRSIGISHRRHLTPADFRVIRDHCHPLFYQITRGTLARIYDVHPQTLSAKIKNAGIASGRDLTRDELQQIYLQLPPPPWLLELDVLHDFPKQKNVEVFFKRVGINRPVKWFKFYFEQLDVIAEKPPFDFFRDMILPKVRWEMKNIYGRE